MAVARGAHIRNKRRAKNREAGRQSREIFRQVQALQGEPDSDAEPADDKK